MVPDLLYCRQGSDGSLDQGRDMQGDVTKHLLVMLIPGVRFISWASSTEDEPLALGPEVGLHGGMPLLPVGASENQDHLVESAGHSEIPVVSQQSQQVNATTDKEKGSTPSASESALSTAILKTWSQSVQCGARLQCGCAGAQ